MAKRTTKIRSTVYLTEDVDGHSSLKEVSTEIEIPHSDMVELALDALAPGGIGSWCFCDYPCSEDELAERMCGEEGITVTGHLGRTFKINRVVLDRGITLWLQEAANMLHGCEHVCPQEVADMLRDFEEGRASRIVQYGLFGKKVYA